MATSNHSHALVEDNFGMNVTGPRFDVRMLPAIFVGLCLVAVLAISFLRFHLRVRRKKRAAAEYEMLDLNVKRPRIASSLCGTFHVPVSDLNASMPAVLNSVRRASEQSWEKRKERFRGLGSSFPSKRGEMRCSAEVDVLDAGLHNGPRRHFHSPSRTPQTRFSNGCSACRSRQFQSGMVRDQRTSATRDDVRYESDSSNGRELAEGNRRAQFYQVPPQTGMCHSDPRNDQVTVFADVHADCFPAGRVQDRGVRAGTEDRGTVASEKERRENNDRFPTDDHARHCHSPYSSHAIQYHRDSDHLDRNHITSSSDETEVALNPLHLRTEHHTTEHYKSSLNTGSCLGSPESLPHPRDVNKSPRKQNHYSKGRFACPAKGTVYCISGHVKQPLVDSGCPSDSPNSSDFCERIDRPNSAEQLPRRFYFSEREPRNSNEGHHLGQNGAGWQDDVHIGPQTSKEHPQREQPWVSCEEAQEPSLSSRLKDPSETRRAATHCASRGEEPVNHDPAFHFSGHPSIHDGQLDGQYNGVLGNSIHNGYVEGQYSGVLGSSIHNGYVEGQYSGVLGSSIHDGYVEGQYSGVVGNPTHYDSVHGQGSVVVGTTRSSTESTARSQSSGFSTAEDSRQFSCALEGKKVRGQAFCQEQVEMETFSPEIPLQNRVGNCEKRFQRTHDCAQSVDKETQFIRNEESHRRHPGVMQTPQPHSTTSLRTGNDVTRQEVNRGSQSSSAHGWNSRLTQSCENCGSPVANRAGSRAGALPKIVVWDSLSLDEEEEEFMRDTSSRLNGIAASGSNVFQYLGVRDENLDNISLDSSQLECVLRFASKHSDKSSEQGYEHIVHDAFHSSGSEDVARQKTRRKDAKDTKGIDL